MKNKIKVSVIVPIHNVEKFINKCVDSIINQTYKNIEIVLVDDGSPDNCPKICDDYAKKDERVKVIHKKCGGVSSARNAGIEASTGEYVCFVDGDDFVMPDYVEYMLNLAIKYDSDYVISPQALGTFNKNNKNSKNDDYVVDAEKALEMLLCYQMREGCYSKLFKRELLGNDLRFSEKIVMGEGFTFNSLAIQKAHKIVLGYKKIYFYRRDNETSATTKFNKDKFENGLYAIKYIKENIKIKTERIEKAWKYANWRTHSDVYDAIVLAKAEKSCDELYRRCLSVVKNDALIAFKVPTKKGSKLRALVMKVCPRLVPLAMIIRRKIFKVGF